MVGRGEELELILDAVRGGGGVVIAGGLGVGKTRLARETAAILDGEFSVEWCAATLSSSSIPFDDLGSPFLSIPPSPGFRHILLKRSGW